MTAIKGLPIHAINVALAIVVGAVAVVHVRASIRLTALVGSVCLVVLLAAPLITALSGRGGGGVQRLLAYRKQLGLWAAAWLTAHAVLSINVYFDGFGHFAQMLGRQPVAMLEVASLGILLALAATSTAWSRNHLPGWKYIHLAVWAIPGMALAASVLAAQDTLGQLPLLGIAPALFALCIAGGIVVLVRNRQRQATDWIRLGFMVAGCVAAATVWSLR